MYLDKNFITDMKYSTGEDELLTGVNYFTSIDIERHFKTLDYNFNYEKLNRNVIIAMVYALNVKFLYSSEIDKYYCNKLSNEYSLQYWLYREVYNNKETYATIMGSIFYDIVPSPSEINNFPETLYEELLDSINRPDVIIESDEDYSKIEISEVIESPKITVTQSNASVKNILWVTRHHMFKEQYNALIRVYGENIRIFQFKARILDYKNVLRVCDKYDISVVGVVLPDDLIINLRNRLPHSIQIIRAKVSEIPEASYTVLDEEGDIICNSSLYANGFEEVKGYTLLTSDVEVATV